MAVHVSLWALLATLIPLADARWYLPKVTASAGLASTGVTPKPTQAVFLDNYLRKRATSGGESEAPTVLIGPDETCGYISGRPGIAYTCYTDYSCVFFTASARIPGNVGCCNSAGCNIRLDCVDYDQYYSSLCDSGCDQDIYTLKCTHASAPYCNTLSFTSNIIDYWCNTRNYSSIQPAFTTFNGETDGRSFSPYASTSISVHSTGSQVQPTAADSASTTTDSSSSGTSTSDSSGGSSSTPVGGIVGGVVGGVAGVGLIGLAAWYLLRRRRLSAEKAAAAQGAGDPNGHFQSPQMQNAPLAGGYAAVPQLQPGSYYDPKMASQYGPPQGGYFIPGQGPIPDGTQSHPQSASPSQFVSTNSDSRMSQAGSSPALSHGSHAVPPVQGQPGYQGPQQGVIHEVPGQGLNQDGETHEIG